MIIEQPEAFKTWLTAVLQPMCEADPEALAKYVSALIKKDKSEEELHRVMVGKLQVFLENETETFVKLVLETLETQNYITTPVIPNTNPPNPSPIKPAKEPEPAEPVNGARKEPEKRARARPRSRSRSWERAGPKRSKSRPAWRNKSPPRRSFRRSRTPSPKHRARAYRNRTPSRSRSRSRPKDGTPTQDSNHGDLDLRLTNSTQSIQSVVVQKAARCRDFDEKGYCMRGEMCPFDHGVDPVVLEDAALKSVLAYNPNLPEGQRHAMGGPRGIGPGAEYNPQAPQMWNRPGYRGPRPPMPPMPRGPPMMGGPFPMQRELIPVPVMDNKGDFNNMMGFRHHHPHNFHHHNRNQANFIGPRSGLAGGIGGLAMKNNPQNCSLELKKVPHGLNSITHLNNHFSKFGKPINIQVNYDGDPEAAIITFSSHAEANAAYRSTEAVLNNRFIKVFWHNGNNAPNNNNDAKQENAPPPTSRSIKDRLGMPPQNVPPNTNKVLNLVQPSHQQQQQQQTPTTNDTPENDEKAALKKEETKQQATLAIKKSQELLATKEKLKKEQNEQRKQVLKIKDDLRKRKQDLLDKQLIQQKILIEKLEKSVPGPQRDLIRDTIKKTQESIEAIRKDLTQLLQQQQQVAKNAHPPQIQHKAKAKEDVQRELLDTELDLMTKQQEGADTSELQLKLNELKAKAGGISRGGTIGAPGMLRGRGGRRFNPISRHLLSKNNLIDNKTNAGLKGNVKSVNKAFKQTHTVDHRPTSLLVSGYEIDEQESVLNHFQTFGEIADFVTDATLPSITLNYKTRKEAEMALIKGKHFQDRTLSITWCNNGNNTTVNVKLTPQRKGLISETDEDRLIDTLPEGDEELGPELSEEVLLQDDEEEDEENEDRSWRR